jgi:hypothetical protein
MSAEELTFWEFEDAPAELRRLIPLAYANGWVAFVCSGRADEIVSGLMIVGNLSGLSVARYETEGGVILAGAHARDGHVHSTKS